MTSGSDRVGEMRAAADGKSRSMRSADLIAW
jgi:hypothetical protein